VRFDIFFLASLSKNELCKCCFRNYRVITVKLNLLSTERRKVIGDNRPQPIVST